MHYAQAAKNALVARVGVGPSPPAAATTIKHSSKTTSTDSDVSVSVDVASPTDVSVSVTAVTITAGAPLNGPTTLQTVTHTTSRPKHGVQTPKNKALNGKYFLSLMLVDWVSTQTADTSTQTQIQSSGANSGSCISGTVDCVNGQFAQCADGTLVLTSCPSGTTCTKIPLDGDNIVVTCDYPHLSKERRNGKRHSHRHGLVGLGPKAA